MGSSLCCCCIKESDATVFPFTPLLKGSDRGTTMDVNHRAWSPPLPLSLSSSTSSEPVR